VGCLRLSVHVPGSRSLKDKRRAIHQLRDRIRARHALHLSEVGHLEDWGRAVLALSSVSNDPRVLRSALDSMASEVESQAVVLVLERQVRLYRPFDTDEDMDGDDPS
jgi:uncharacterized protein